MALKTKETQDFLDSSLLLPQTGIDHLLKDPEKMAFLKNKKVAVLSNQSSVTAEFVPSAYALHRLIGSHLIGLFTLEHGWSAFCAAGEEVKNSQESQTNLPVYSLYGPLFKENLRILESIEVLIIDVQDVGVRCYTYAATCARLINYVAAEKLALEIILCDRPNPLGTKVQGPPWNAETQSLVSYLDVPFQHGKTLAGLLKDYNKTLENPVCLSVIPHSEAFQPYKHLWIPPSPGLPDWDSVLLYPGLVLLEGTNLSEGRGSSVPFKCVAAPDLDFMKLVEALNQLPQSGMRARPFSFTPESHKFKGQACQGVQIHITDREKVNGFALGVHLLHILFHIYPLFEWTCYKGKYWIDRLTGSSDLRQALCQGRNPQEIIKSWEKSLKNL